nr:hypothetical protein [Acholeplasmatales bacterium]
KLNDNNLDFKFDIKNNEITIYFNENITFTISNIVFPSDNDDILFTFKYGTNAFMELMKINQTGIPQPLWYNEDENLKLSWELSNTKSLYYEKLYEMSIQKTICRFISKNDEGMRSIEELLRVLENWSQKTYEGHKLCYGLLVDNVFHQKNQDISLYNSNFLSFLDDEYSAVLSDGMSSLFKVDSYCNFVDFVTVTELYDNESIKEIGKIKDSYLPYRFFEIISYYVTGDLVGIFLLQSGDLVIAKNKEIRFIKRNGKWMNFSRFTFIETIKKKVPCISEKSDDLIKNIYATTIDVSLSHTGGIIAVINNKEKLYKDEILSEIDDLNSDKEISKLFFGEFEKKYNILKGNDLRLKSNKIDSLINHEDYSDDDKKELDKLVDSIPELYSLKKDITKRLTKRIFVKKILKSSKFNEMDRKKRAELIGLDGACIIDLDGNIISFGAIITNDAGSSGGGRGAAAKKLSNYDGFAIKISTDGYIEVFSELKKIYSIK